MNAQSPGGDAPGQLSVTVAVCTRDNPRDLARCLHALVSHELPNVELVVVDNASPSNETRRITERYHPMVRYETEPVPGLNRARNRAMAVAEGDIVAFVDDDVVPRKDWLRALCSSFQVPEVAMATGLVVPAELETPAQIYFEEYGGFGCGLVGRTFGPMAASHLPDPRWAIELGTGANMAFRRSVFDRVGLFDPALDVGTPTGGGGDIEMFYRVLKEGYAIRYEPTSVVAHRHRRSYEELRKQIEGWGSGLVAFVIRTGTVYPEARWSLARLGLRWVAQQGRRLLRSIVHPPGFPRRLILDELRGAALGVHRYHRSLRQVAMPLHDQQVTVSRGRGIDSSPSR